jgi:repressor LexA
MEAKVPQPLTQLEARVLDYLVEYLRDHTYQPSVREIGSRFAIKSTKTVSELLQSLADKGWVERDPSRSRGVRLLGLKPDADTVAVPVLDAPGTATVEFHLDRRLVGGAGAWLLPMWGNHLAEEGIRTGDLLIVEPVGPDEPGTGDLLVTQTAGATTVRRCRREADTLVLEPVAAGEPSLTLTSRQAASVIRGRVAGVVRRIRPLQTTHDAAIARSPAD